MLRRIIEFLSGPGDIVLYPFCGSVSTLVAAVSLERKALGIEKNELFYKIAADRLAWAQSNHPTAV